uniref:DegT/DnrJ/EryC1/StrS aminotransferase family protein n=1 Tax=viral metagenome TaxID=1070528 RepID=A0A6C0KWY7_9ZZZZ
MAAYFPIKRKVGNHSVLSYNTDVHSFRHYFETLYNTNDLEHLHETSTEFQSDSLSDVETSLHKKFYTDIKSNPEFKNLYCSFIKAIYSHLFPKETQIIYQSFPSVRFQFINNVAIPPHYDSDEIGCHPLGEKNFLIPITSMYGTNRIFLESEPGKGDFEGMTLSYGDLLMFNGNKCTHYNEKNIESTLRISLDFRIISRDNYIRYVQDGKITMTNPREPETVRKPTRMVVGGYYQTALQTSSLEDMMCWHSQTKLLLQSQPNFDIAEANACYEYMKDGLNFVTEYQQTTILERLLGEYIGVKNVLMTTSGSMALALALLACGIGAGDDVIVPDYTMIATINSVKMVGANPILCDVDAETLTLNKEIISAARTPATKCVLFVSLNNRHSDIAGIKEYCDSTGLILIEDAAQSLGARVKGQHFGTFGKVGCFSLSTPKIISTGQGGFVVTDDDDLAKKMAMIKNFGRKTSGNDNFELYGLNMKFTDIQAVIGIEQMKKLPNRVIQMKELYLCYYNNLRDCPIKMFSPKDSDYIPWFIDIYTDRRDELATFLKFHNIQTRPTYPEIHLTPMYYSNLDYPVTSYVSKNGLFLPSHTLVTHAEVIYICSLIRLFYEY